MIIEALCLKKKYFRDENSFMAVDGASLSVGEGEFVCVTGRSGSGKTTLLNMLAGLLPPDSGSVTFEGREYGGMNDDELSELRNTRLGYIMQGPGVLANFTVTQNVILPHVISGREGDPTDRAMSLLEQTGIRGLAAQYPSSLSGGELRRVAVARALLMSPKLLIADEPTGDLDEETTRGIMDLFSSIAKEGTAILMVTHDAETARRCDRRYDMKAGRITSPGAHLG
ncbi:MAG: ABC transporter ATP-binding protein [Synergistaceae bacterium]|nr:ABC transporter ATP-binding protein [Synergistaceae bacterium]